LTLTGLASSASYKCKDSAGNWSEQACPDYKARQKSEFEAAMREARKYREPEIGMPAEDALALAYPWGKPDHVNTTKTAAGVREQWVYTDVLHGTGVRFLYFTNGVLTSIQE
jgi:hypothetical protein